MAVTTAAVIGAGAAVAGAVSARNSAKEGIDAQEDQNAANQQFIREQAEIARTDAIPLFDAAAQNRILGSQGALDIFGQTIPQQLQTFQQGNVGAQQALLAGQPQFSNALLGLPIDFNAVQAQQLQFDPSFAQQTLPEFQTSPVSITPPEQAGTGFDTGFLGSFGTNFNNVGF